MINVNILSEIINQRTGGYYIKLEDKKVLNKILKRYHKKNIFDKYKMSYVYQELEDSILLIIHKDFEFI